MKLPILENRYIALTGILLATSLPEIVLHLATAQGPTTRFNSGLLLCFLFAVVPALLAFALITLIPCDKWRKAIAITFSAVVFVLCASQLVYYRIFGTFYSAYSMSRGGQVLQFWDIALEAVLENLPVLLLMAAPLVLVCICKYTNFPRRRFSIFWAGGALVLQLLLILILPVFGKEAMSPYDLYHNNSDSYFNVNRLGLLTAFRLDVTRGILGTEVGGTIDLDISVDETLPSVPSYADPTPSVPAVQDPDVPQIDTSPNVLNIDFETLIAQEKNDYIKQVHQYFASRTPSNKNAYTGMFAGKNLILITAEAFSHLLVDEVRTPTLYKMMHEGVYFSNFYVPDWGTSTTDGEYAFLTGTVPKSNVWSFSQSSDNAMPLTMSRQLLNLGYSAYAYHGHLFAYYDRNKYLENLGYTYKAYYQGLDVTYTWPESDVEVVDLSTADYVDKEPFTAYYMTISGHKNFNFYGNYISAKNQDLVAHEPYSEPVRAYLACQLELEFSLQLLFERLEEAGVLENTVIVLTADHYPNGLTVEELSELAGHTIDTDFEIYRNGCIIYTPGMTPVTVDEPCSHLDLLPTISNLFGLEFDSRLYMGRDIFSDAAPLVFLRNRSWITDLASYNCNTGEVVNFTSTPVSDAYVQKINKEISNRFAVSSRILDHDYWRILFE